jgi:hypothetical protein
VFLITEVTAHETSEMEANQAINQRKEFLQVTHCLVRRKGTITKSSKILYDKERKVISFEDNTGENNPLANEDNTLITFSL